MKKIINGKVYDTEKAQELASYSNGGGWRDFRHFEETLYRKRTGEYFLYGEGGPMTHYAVSDGISGWTGGERIMPLTYEKATKWAEEHLDGDEYEAIFGVVSEDDSTVQLNFSVPASLKEKLLRISSAQDKSMSEVLEDLILGRYQELFPG